MCVYVCVCVCVSCLSFCLSLFSPGPVALSICLCPSVIQPLSPSLSTPLYYTSLSRSLSIYLSIYLSISISISISIYIYILSSPWTGPFFFPTYISFSLVCSVSHSHSLFVFVSSLSLSFCFQQKGPCSLTHVCLAKRQYLTVFVSGSTFATSALLPFSPHCVLYRVSALLLSLKGHY